MAEKQKVLIVDDEPRNRRIVAEILEDLVELSQANTGEEALALMESNRPDLILLDIMMPGIDGYEVCRRVRAHDALKRARIILISGKAMVEERLKGYEVGADDYITKPFVPEELLSKAKVFLRLSQAERELADFNLDLERKVAERTAQLLDVKAKFVEVAKMSALGEMAGGIAHEINTPLSTILLNAEQIGELLGEDPIDIPLAKQMIEKVVNTVGRISSIINGLKAFSRDGSKDGFVAAYAKQVIDQTLVLCREKMKNLGVVVKVNEIDPAARLQCRPVQISQVLLNLIGNACDAIEDLPEKWIEVTLESQGDKVRISVTDSGSGINEANRNKIFQPFFTTKGVAKGTGLGLSISKGIMESHQGSLRLDDDCPHTRFILECPIAATEPDSTAGAKR